MESNEVDAEQKLYEVYGKLEKLNLLEDWKHFTKKVMKYLELEWGADEPPTLNEIINVTTQFSESKDMDKIFDAVGDKDTEFLLSFMVAGFDTIINGEKEV